jgi:hypothetical protein
VGVRRSSRLRAVKLDASDEQAPRISGEDRAFCGSYVVEVTENCLLRGS